MMGMVAIVWPILAPGAGALWTALAILGTAAALSIAEQSAIKKCSILTPSPDFLVRGFLAAAAVMWIGAGLVLILFFARFGSLQLVGSGMAPTLEKGERVLYEKRVDAERLRRGVIIAYRLSNRSAWGEPGVLMISRILAVPGDQLSIRDGKYVINGEDGPPVAVTNPYTPVLEIPAAPETLTLDTSRFFIIQESPTGGFDSRVLSWVDGDAIISTQMYYLSLRGVLKAVE